jgi:hypothetical protein
MGMGGIKQDQPNCTIGRRDLLQIAGPQVNDFGNKRKMGIEVE